MKRDWAWKAFSFSCSKRKKQSRDLGEQSKARSCSLLEIRAEMRSFNNKSSFGKQEKDDKKVLTTHCTSVFKCSPGQGELHSPWQPRSQDKFPLSCFYVSVISLQESLTHFLSLTVCLTCEQKDLSHIILLPSLGFLVPNSFVISFSPQTTLPVRYCSSHTASHHLAGDRDTSHSLHLPQSNTELTQIRTVFSLSYPHPL